MYYLAALLFVGCSVSDTSHKIKEFTKCYVDKLPAPFWVCYQSSFLSVGKVHSSKLNRLKQEEAYSLAVTDLINKLRHKTALLLQKLKIKDHEKILDDMKDFVVLNAIQGESWYNTKEKLIYVQVKVGKEDFKKYLLSSLENIKEEEFNKNFNEVF